MTTLDQDLISAASVEGTDRRSRPRQLQWVVKVSKFCNLRCKYCYEYTSLSDRSRMSLPQLRKMFEHITEFYRGAHRDMAFVWHGGEPLLIEPSYYEQIFEIQKETLEAAGIPYNNSVQTNLTTLTDPIISLLKKGFKNVGVSLDLFGGQRVTANGVELEDRVITNIQRLRDAGVSPGCITVLSQATIDHVVEIYRFYEAANMSFRLLPIYRTGYAGQQDRHALTPAEIRHAFIQAVDLWFASDCSIQVRPINDYVINAIRMLHIDRIGPQFYDPREAEVVCIVDTDGTLHSNGDAYDPKLCHGNIFEQRIDEMYTSAGYRLSVDGSVERIAATCASCKFHGACSGFYMGQATPEQRIYEDGKLVCSVAQPVQDYVLSRLRDPGLYEAMMAKSALSAAIPQLDHPEM